MARYIFEDIAINSTAKKKPIEEDKYTYLGLENLDPETLKVTRLVMKLLLLVKNLL